MPAPYPDHDDVPDTLPAHEQWLCWRSEERDGKQTKIPIDPSTGAFASTTEPDTWASFDVAREQVRLGDEDGIGFVFTDDDPIVGVDLDDCRVPETGTASEWADDVIERLDSYTEVSPSGTGFHVLVEGSLPDGRNRAGDLELYETARFFTVTGDHVEGTPTTIESRGEAIAAVHREYIAADEDGRERQRPPVSTDDGAIGSAASLDDDELLTKARAAANGEKFERLYSGDTSGYESHSEADMALCSLLAFWTGGDPRQMDRLFRDSGLLREKWDEQHFADGSTYGEKTIERAIAGSTEFYEPNSGHSRDAQSAAPAGDRDAGLGSTDIDTDHVEQLEAQLEAALQENEELRDELEAVREERDRLQKELEGAESEDDGGLLSW